MKVVYRKPDIYEKFEAAIAKAKEGKKHIDSFQISEEEFKEFIDRIKSDDEFMVKNFIENVDRDNLKLSSDIKIK